MADKTLVESVARAIVHLNFNEPDQALDVLLGALSDFHFEHNRKEAINGNATAAAA